MRGDHMGPYTKYAVYASASHLIMNGSEPVIFSKSSSADFGSTIWDSTNGLNANLDQSADILYVSRGAAVPAYTQEDEDNPDIWYRFAINDHSPIGVTIFRAAGYIGRDRAAQITSAFLGLSGTQIRERLAALGI